MTHSYIISAARTPQTRLLGSQSSLTAPELGGRAIAALQQQTSLDPVSIDQVIMGQVVSAGAGQAPARQAATHAALPPSVGAVTVNKVCGSGLYAIMLADMAIRSGVYQRVIAGGMESMSQAPHLLVGGRSGWKFGQGTLLDALEVDGLRCANSGAAMGSIAQQVAVDFKISRADQDAWTVRSHQRAMASQRVGDFAREIVEVEFASKKQTVRINQDEGPREDCSLESLARLQPVFALKELAASEYGASVTAGNASSLADGAAAVAVVDQQALDEVKPAWAFRIEGYANFAAAHDQLFTAPAYAIEALLKRTGRKLADVDLVEINEAFAAQVIACNEILKLDSDKVNVRGGAIALGHPLGCSGARVLVTLIHALLDKGLGTGIAALCLGGGEGVALLIERR